MQFFASAKNKGTRSEDSEQSIGLVRGHGVFAVKHSDNIEEFQAYLHNIGHEDPGTTFKYYSKLAQNDKRNVILREE